jgi:SAM-dependent methyltransferase
MRAWQANLRKVARTRLDVPLLLRGAVRADAPDVEALLAPGVRVYRDGPVLVDRKLSPLHFASQFIENADTYHQRNFERLDFVDLIDRCLTLAGIDRELPQDVLDIGSGSGSSVFATSRLLPKASICATDISPQLVGMLARFVESNEALRGRVRAFCFDLHRRFFRADKFDLVIGAAILHHLLDPCAALANVVASVKPGGRMIFVEPLEAGSLVLTMLYAHVLEVLAGAGEGAGTLADLMRAWRLDIQCRLGPPVVSPRTALLDDKWVFDTPYLIELARQLGLAKVEIHPAQHDLTNVFEHAFRSILADSGHAELPIPPGVLDAVREFDRSIDANLKPRLCPTGIVVFTK